MHIQIYQQELQCSVVIRLTYDLGSKNVLVPGQEMQVMIIYIWRENDSGVWGPRN